MNQDGLENFFGCLRECQSTKLVEMHFRSAYATSFINNLASAHSIKSNCEADSAKPLLSEMQDFFFSESERVENECGQEENMDDCVFDCKLNKIGFKNDGYEYDYDPISVNVKFSEKDEIVKFTNASHSVCDKLFKVIKCLACRETLKTKTIPNDICKPTDLFKQNFAEVNNLINIILPQICEQKFVKKKHTKIY